MALIIAARTLPSTPGFVALALGILGIAAWLLFLRHLPVHQQRTAAVSDVEPIDDQVTGYIVSILLPLVAAGDPTAGDLVAYGLCAVLILAVAFVSDLAAANPLIYLMGFRVARAKVDGERTIVLVDGLEVPEGDVTVRRAVGVTYVSTQ